MTRTLLPEITDVIIDHLHDCLPALCSCALPVTHASAYFHIFNTVILESYWRRDDQMCTKLCKTIKMSPRVAGFIRQLHIDDSWQYGNPHLPSFLDTLTHLRVLTLRHMTRFSLTLTLPQSISFRRVAFNPITTLH